MPYNTIKKLPGAQQRKNIIKMTIKSGLIMKAINRALIVN